MPVPLPSWGNGTVRFDADLDSDMESDTCNRNPRFEDRELTLLMRDTWQPCSDLESELQARCALFEKWATADQAFCDVKDQSGKSHGSLYGLSSSANPSGPDAYEKRFVCVAEVDKKLHPENYKRLLKILILCYMSRHLTGAPYKLGHAFGNSTRKESPHLPAFLPASDQRTLVYSLSSIFLENADWRAIHATRTGTVFFYEASHWYIIDQEALDTGRVKLVDFNRDGSVEAQEALRPFNISRFRILAEGLGWRLRDFDDHLFLAKFFNTP
ncbi:hypothetical protein BJX62DRAFT_236931 [Aspergillus germanicus]